MHPHIPRPRRKATRTCTDTASVVRTVHGEFMWPNTARVNEKNRSDLQQPSTVHVRYGSLADIAAAIPNVRFTPESGHRRKRSSCPLSANSGHMRSYGLEISQTYSLRQTAQCCRDSMRLIECWRLRL